MAVEVALPADGGSARVGTAVALFPTQVGGALQAISGQQYFVAPDGQRFLMNTLLEGAPVAPITLILNWKPQPAGSSE